MNYNLSSICKAANRFHNKGYSRSAAFVLAWRLAKATAETKISCVSYGERQTVLAALATAYPADVRVELHREPGNRYDRNAIAIVVIADGCAHKLGYMPMRAARLLSSLMDMGQTVKAALANIYGGWLEGISYGARLRLSI